MRLLGVEESPIDLFAFEYPFDCSRPCRCHNFLVPSSSPKVSDTEEWSTTCCNSTSIPICQAFKVQHVWLESWAFYCSQALLEVQAMEQEKDGILLWEASNWSLHLSHFEDPHSEAYCSVPTKRVWRHEWQLLIGCPRDIQKKFQHMEWVKNPSGLAVTWLWTMEYSLAEPHWTGKARHKQWQVPSFSINLKICQPLPPQSWLNQPCVPFKGFICLHTNACNWAESVSYKWQMHTFISVLVNFHGLQF